MADETRDLTAQHTWTFQPPPSDAGKEDSRSRISALTILYHPDVSRIGDRAALLELAAGRAALLSRADPGFAVPGSPATAPRPLGDLHLSRSPLRFLPGNEPGAVRALVGESRTRLVADGQPVPEARDFTAAEVRQGVVLELADRVVLLLHEAGAPGRSERLASIAPVGGLIGESEGIKRVRDEIRRVADLDVPVLIRGETGTGKELVAHAIHAASRRGGSLCLSVNMGAIPPALAPAELFGTVRGAYTGAVRDQPGYFQRADGGTLFLDEIGEAPPEVQVMLLRVLETAEVQRVGGSAVQKIDVRLITATDANLENAIEEGKFRAPLLHRLSGYEILIPPLRERRDDFGRLLLHFLRQELKAVGEEHRLALPAGTAAPWLPTSLVARLARHDWPGNVRQLRNAVRQIVIDSRAVDRVQIGPQIERLLREVDQPSRGAAAAAPPPSPHRKAPAGSYRAPSEVTVAEILAALRESHWELKSAAAQLGISRPSLYVLIDKLPGIRKAADLTQEEIAAAREECGGSLDAAAERLEVSRRGLLQRMKQLGME
jgi:two-component system, NtrC family, nitrogen regulation response regulator GlnG